MCLTIPLEKVGCTRIAALIEIGVIHRLQFVPRKAVLDGSPANANVNVLILLTPVLIIYIGDQSVKIILVLECEMSRKERVAAAKDRRRQT